jgi:hypothetical protein
MTCVVCQTELVEEQDSSHIDDAILGGTLVHKSKAYEVKAR